MAQPPEIWNPRHLDIPIAPFEGAWEGQQANQPSSRWEAYGGAGSSQLLDSQ